MLALLYTLHVLICIFLIMVVLLQQGKGADLSVFGGGGTMTAFGARGAATMLHKLTVFSFVAFIVTTMTIGVFLGSTGSGSVMSDIEAAAAQQEATEEPASEPVEPVGALEGEADPTDAASAAEAAAAPTEDAAEPADDGGDEGSEGAQSDG